MAPNKDQDTNPTFMSQAQLPGQACNIAIWCVVWIRGSENEDLLPGGTLPRYPTGQWRANSFLR